MRVAIVREFIHPNGAHVIVRDDCYRDLSEEEIERRRDEVRRVMAMIEYRRQQEEKEK